MLFTNSKLTILFQHAHSVTDKLTEENRWTLLLVIKLNIIWQNKSINIETINIEPRYRGGLVFFLPISVRLSKQKNISKSKWRKKYLDFLCHLLNYYLLNKPIQINTQKWNKKKKSILVQTLNSLNLLLFKINYQIIPQNIPMTVHLIIDLSKLSVNPKQTP